MKNRLQPSFDPEAAARAIAGEKLPNMDTPVIDIQELEHQSWPDSRVDRDERVQATQMDELIRREAGITQDAGDAQVERKVSDEVESPDRVAETRAVGDEEAHVERTEDPRTDRFENARTVGAEIAQGFRVLPRGREIF